MSAAKNWCFTINNPTDFEKECLKVLHLDASVQYIIWQVEEGEEGTPHVQGKQIVFVSPFGG